MCSCIGHNTRCGIIVWIEIAQGIGEFIMGLNRDVASVFAAHQTRYPPCLYIWGIVGGRLYQNRETFPIGLCVYTFGPLWSLASVTNCDPSCHIGASFAIFTRFKPIFACAASELAGCRWFWAPSSRQLIIR
jgi:hypothetical protein